MIRNMTYQIYLKGARTMKGNLKEKLKFPLYAYEKFNGFLGLVSYNSIQNKLHFATKGSVSNSYAALFELLLQDLMPPLNYINFIEYLTQNDVTVAFEVIDNKKDPHIIPSPLGIRSLVLLAIIPNQINYQHIPYETLKKQGDLWGFLVPARVSIKDIDELKHFYSENASENVYDFESTHIEGYVIEGSDGFMFKYKAPYYLYWKSIRTNVKRYITNPNWENELALDKKITDKDKSIVRYIVESLLASNKKTVNMVKILEDTRFRKFILTLETK